eukprot:Sspe_Gene.32973::Locus_16138_Transcript_1_1_Confidence_1.000_Length_895::g.32973::m.32973
MEGEEGMEQTGPVVMRKLSRKAGLRKRARDVDGDAEEAEEAGASEKLRETRELQKIRSWKMSSKTGKEEEKEESPTPAREEGVLKPLETAFDRQKKAVSAMQDKHAQLRQQFVEEELQKRRREAEAKEAAASESGTEVVNPEDSVLLLKPDLLTHTVEKQDVGNRWLTGIQEIQLPLSYKIKNIEETENAKSEAFKDIAKHKASVEEKRSIDPGHYRRFSYNPQESMTAAVAQLSSGGQDGDRLEPAANVYEETDRSKGKEPKGKQRKR